MPRWAGAPPAAPARNALISLALRPAPATDAWRSEGPHLVDVAGACAGVTLLEAPAPGAEAAAIACGLRGGARRRAAVPRSSPPTARCRARSRRSSTAGACEADDSAGSPLVQSAPGRLLLGLAEMRGHPVEAEPLWRC